MNGLAVRFESNSNVPNTEPVPRHRFDVYDPNRDCYDPVGHVPTHRKEA